MPLYDIGCKNGHEKEVFIPLAMFEAPLPTCGCGETMHRILRPLHVIADIQPYRAVATDIETGDRPMITSRSQHRDFLKRNGLAEVGNEMPKAQYVPPAPDKNEIARTVKRVMDEKGIRA